MPIAAVSRLGNLPPYDAVVEYWADGVDTELNLLGGLAGDRDEVLGIAVHGDRGLVELVVSADTAAVAVADIEQASRSLADGKVDVAVRRSRFTAEDLRRAEGVIFGGRWAQGAGSIGGPMTMAYLAAQDELEIRLPTSASDAGRRLEAELQGVATVIYEDSFDADGRPRAGR